MEDEKELNSNLGKRILIIGSSGAGKSTFSIQLSKIINIPIIHLDKEYWKSGWVKPEKDEWNNKINDLLNKEEWIMDGNFKSTLDIRLSKADTCIFLDYNRLICLFRIFKRGLFGYKNKRIDMAEGCVEKLPEISFIKFVWDYPKKSRPQIIEKMEKHKNVNKIILKNDKEADFFMKRLGK